MIALAILDTVIRQFDGLYSLNDLYKASGGARKHQPSNFMRIDTTVALMEEIRSSDVSIIPAKTIRGRGKPQGTYVCKELVYAYAMWISPSFHLKVIRAFDALQQPNPSEALPVAIPMMLGTETKHLAGKRFLVRFSDDGHYSAKSVPDDCVVMNIEQFIKALSDPNGMYVSSAALSDLIVYASRKLASRIRV